jgi:hypothetical protein
MYHLKKAQKLWIAQTVRAGFPPDVVAFWNDHSLSMAERHYMLSDAYLPDREPRDLGQFDALSEYGMLCRNQWSKPIEGLKGVTRGSNPTPATSGPGVSE